MVHVAMPREPHEILQLFRRNEQEVRESVYGLFDVHPGAKLRVLAGDSGWALSGVACHVLLAPDLHQGCGPDRDTIGAGGERLREIGKNPQSSGDHQGNAIDLVLAQVLSCPIDGEHCGNRSRVFDELRRRPRGAGTFVEGDEVGLQPKSDLQVSLYFTRHDLDSDGPAVRLFPKPLDPPIQLILAGVVAEAAGTDDVGTRGGNPRIFAISSVILAPGR